MATGPIQVYGGVLPPQGVPITLVPTALGMAVDGQHHTLATLPMPEILPEGTLAHTTDNKIYRTKAGKWKEIK